MISKKRFLGERNLHQCLVVRIFWSVVSLVGSMLSEPLSKCNLGTYYLNPCLNMVGMHLLLNVAII